MDTADGGATSFTSTSGGFGRRKSGTEVSAVNNSGCGSAPDGSSSHCGVPSGTPEPPRCAPAWLAMRHAKVSVNERMDVTDACHTSVNVFRRQQGCNQEANRCDQRGYRTDIWLHLFIPSWLAEDPISGNAASRTAVDHTTRAMRGHLSSSHS